MFNLKPVHPFIEIGEVFSVCSKKRNGKKMAYLLMAGISAEMRAANNGRVTKITSEHTVICDVKCPFLREWKIVGIFPHKRVKT